MYSRSIALLSICWSLVFSAAAANAEVVPFSVEMDDARATATATEMVIETSRIKRSFDIREHDLFSKALVNKRTGTVTSLNNILPSSEFGTKSLNLSIGAAKVDLPLTGAPHILVSINQSFGDFEVRRDCRVFPTSPAIECVFWFKGSPTTTGLDKIAGRDEIAALDPNTTPGEPLKLAVILERLTPNDPHFSAEIYDFSLATDLRDTFVRSERTLPYRVRTYHPGSLTFFNQAHKNDAIFILKLAPHSNDQLHYPNYDFSVRNGELAVHGIGVSARDLSAQWVRGYGFAVGVSDTNDRRKFLALRDYTSKLRPYRPERDSMLMSNTWGDRSRDGRLTEQFVSREIELADELTLSHVQLDDGWQSGLSKNSAVKGGRTWTEWTKDDWLPNKLRFPNGIGLLADKAKNRELKLGFWFNPTRTDGYALWRRDAGIIVDLANRYNAHSFKIDGMNIGTQTADENLRKLFESVTAQLKGDVVLNLDVTADARGGLFYLNEFGNLFLENRYTDWGNYYPHRTLRNLWTMSQFYAPQFLQIEFLNVNRNSNQYQPGDKLAPSANSLEYVFATTMAAQPLAWMELSGLDTDQRKSLKNIIRVYRGFKTEFHSGQILPIGDEPSGASWTGFQSITSPAKGSFIIYRESNIQNSAYVETLLDEGAKVKLTSLGLRYSYDIQTVGPRGVIKFNLQTMKSFDYIKYEVQK